MIHNLPDTVNAEVSVDGVLSELSLKDVLSWYRNDLGDDEFEKIVRAELKGSGDE